MGPNTLIHPSQTTLSPMDQTQTPTPNPFHPWPTIVTHTHALNPFTHGPKHSHTPIPDPLSPMAQTQTPTPNPFHPWPTILTHTHALNPFTHGPKHSHTPRHRCRHPSLGHFYPTYVHTVCSSLIVMFHDGSCDVLWCVMMCRDGTDDVLSWFMMCPDVLWWFT